MLTQILEVVSMTFFLLGIASIGGAIDSDGSLAIPFVVLIAGIVVGLIARHEGGFRRYEKDIDNADIDRLLRDVRKHNRRFERANKGTRNGVL